MDRAPAAEIARSERARAELAKAWLIRIIERTPLADLEDLPVGWISREAPPLIAEILDAVANGDPGALDAGRAGEAASKLGVLRRGETAPARIPRDLAALHSLLIDALRRELPDGATGEFARAVERLAETFGSVQAGATEALVRKRAGEARRDQLTGLPGLTDLHEWLRVLLAEYRRYRHPFSLSLIDIEGLSRINDAYGRGAGDRMLVAVSSVIERQVRGSDRAFRTAEDEFSVIAPHQTAVGLRPMGERLAHLVESSQAGEAPRVGIAVGIASCPEHGESEDELWQAAEQGVYTAKAEGRHVGIAGLEDGLFLEDDR